MICTMMSIKSIISNLINNEMTNQNWLMTKVMAIKKSTFLESKKKLKILT